MTDRPPIPAPIRDGRLIVVGRPIADGDVPGCVEAVLAGGVRVIELTMDDPEDVALGSVAELARIGDDHGLFPGAGTVRSVSAARRATDAGARLIVSPHADTELARRCAAMSVPCVMGAFSPEIRGPFPDIDIIPTGIDDPAAVGEWFAAGAMAIGIRSGWLAGDGEPGGITARTRQMSTVASS